MAGWFDGKFPKDLYKLVKDVKVGDRIFSKSVYAGLADQGYCVDSHVDRAASRNTRTKTSDWLRKFGFVCISKDDGTWERVSSDYSEKDIEELVRSYGFDNEFVALLYNHLKGIPINHSTNSSELASFIRANGYEHKMGNSLTSAMRQLGFKCSGRGPNAYWYRVDFPELDERITKEAKKTEAPTLQERLAAQIESGERKAPAGYSAWKEEKEKKEKAKMEQHKALEDMITTSPAIVDMPIANPETVDIVTTEKPYEFEEVETTVKLVGKFGTYKVVSNGQTVVDLLVSGTLSDEELRMLSRELDAVYCRARRMSGDA